MENKNKSNKEIEQKSMYRIKKAMKVGCISASSEAPQNRCLSEETALMCPCTWGYCQWTFTKSLNVHSLNLFL